MNGTKPKPKTYEIPIEIVYEAYKKVKANAGSEGIDGISIEEFESNLDDNCYKIWNRMSSGSYFPPPVKAVEIPKKSGEIRTLGIPTVSDRIAQTVVKTYFEPLVEPFFHKDSYGYRPGKSAIDAIGTTRRRCWDYDWVLEFDIKGLFDNIDHEMMIECVKRHTNSPWMILYIERWLKTTMIMPDGLVRKRTAGTPQGGVISPVLANLFLHYAFDMYMQENHPNMPFERYADDGIVHCRTLKDANELRNDLVRRFREWKLELHPTKTKIVYCKDENRKGEYETTKFDFLGYTFRARDSKNKYGKYFMGFSPAVSNNAVKTMQQTIHGWHMHLKPDKSIEDLSKMFNPIVRGWINYYGCFYKSELYKVLRQLNLALIRWVRHKYKKLNRYWRRAARWLNGIARREPELFNQWQIGILP